MDDHGGPGDGRPECPFDVVAPTPFYTPGGCSARILGELRGLSASCVAPAVYTYGTGQDVPGIRTIRAGPRVPGLTTGFHWSRPGMDVLLARRFLTTSRRPTSLHVHLHEGALIGRIDRSLRGVPYVADLQGSLAEETLRYAGNGTLRRARSTLDWVERVVERGASFVITSSPGMEQALRDRWPERTERIRCIDDGVPEELILEPRDRPEARASIRARLDDPADRIVIAYMGSLSPSQGIDRLLTAAPEIFRRVPHAYLRLYGVPNPGSSIEAYLALCRGLGIESRVAFMGPIPYAEATRALAGADIAITWKANPLEGNGKIPVYMAAGLPTVVLRSPSAERYLGPDGARGGILANSIPEAVDGVVRLAGDPTQRDRLGAAALRVAREELTWADRGRQILEIHRTVAATGPAG